MEQGNGKMLVGVKASLVTLHQIYIERFTKGSLNRYIHPAPIYSTQVLLCSEHSDEKICFVKVLWVP